MEWNSVPHSGPSAKNTKLLGSLDHALTVLETIAAGSRALGVSEISRRTGFPKTSVHRVLETLAARGYLRKRPGSGSYELTLRLFKIGSVVVDQLEIRPIARPHLERLMKMSGETTHLAIMDAEGVFYIDKIESAQSIRMYSYIGRRAPLHCTAVGKVLLAYQSKEAIEEVLSGTLKRYTDRSIVDKGKLREELTKIYRQGYSIDSQELEEGLLCIAAPVRNYEGTVIGAVSVSGPSMRLTRSRIKQFIPMVVEAGVGISEGLGYEANTGPRFLSV